MSRPNIIHIEVTGETGTGKTSLLAFIEKALKNEEYLTVSPELESERRMASQASVEKNMPDKNSSVIVLSETNVPRQGQ